MKIIIIIIIIIIIFQRQVLLLASFWKREFLNLGNGLSWITRGNACGDFQTESLLSGYRSSSF